LCLRSKDPFREPAVWSEAWRSKLADILKCHQCLPSARAK
jgi:hypothetical protein